MTDANSRLSAALADHYRIERELGEGGMATVYLAEDLKHKRKVALKVLKPELAAVLGAERFVQEITTTANLQHPHILPLFDSGTIDGFLYYVMPFIDGETLRDKLDRETQLGIEEAVRITTEVADALDYAHRNGVIHRDIKPENILLHDGRPMVADFGIALALSAAAGGRMTETGLSLGTPHYMSPEQATAEKELTNRSDIYSLGSVLYEMLTGNPPHIGASAQQIIMKIVTEEAVPVTSTRRSVPQNIAAAVLKSLEKLPADRFTSAAEFAQALGDPGFAVPGLPTGGQARASAGASVPRSWFHSAIVLSAVLLGVAIVSWLGPTEPIPMTRQRVQLWQHSVQRFATPGLSRYATQAAIAPDGSSIVFSDSLGDGTQLMRKVRDGTVPSPMEGTEGALSPFFSPDGAWVGYITSDRKLKKVPTAGGGSVTIVGNISSGYTVAAWMDDLTIIYVDAGDALRRISSDGGPVTVVEGPGTERIVVSTLWPLPGSGGFLFTSCPGNCAIASDVYVYDFAADSARLLISQAAGAWYAPTGHLLYTLREGGLYAVAFDPDRLTLESGAFPVIPGVEPTAFTLSASGTVLYSVGGGSLTSSELVWVSRDGSTEPIDADWRGRFEYPALSPDGKALAVSLQEQSTQLWIRRTDGTRQKLIHEGTVNWRPAWTPDGRSLAFISNRGGVGSQDDPAVYLMPVDGSAPAELLLDHTFGIWEAEFSPDGQWLVIRSDEEGGDPNVRARRLVGDTTLIPLLVEKGLTAQVAVSPDSRWLAYASLESGSIEVYVSSFPDMASKQLISRDGGTEPRWARNGRELFFKGSGQLMAVEVAPGPTFVSGSPRALFSLAGYREATNRQQYDVAPDGRFVMIRESGGGVASDVVYAEHWFEELKAKVPR